MKHKEITQPAVDLLNTAAVIRYKCRALFTVLNPSFTHIILVNLSNLPERKDPSTLQVETLRLSEVKWVAQIRD